MRSALLALNLDADSILRLAQSDAIKDDLHQRTQLALEVGVFGQAPGAQASAQTSALAPFEQQNIGLGANLATFGFPYVEHQGTPDYLSVLSQLNQFGKGSTFSAPSGTPGVGP